MENEKEEKLKKLRQHLYNYYDVLHWGEELEIFLNENLNLYDKYDGNFLEFTEKGITIGGLVLYFNKEYNSHAIGCAAINSLYRRKGYFKVILTTLIDVHPRLYLFSKPHLVPFYTKIFKYQKPIKDINIHLFSNYETTLEEKGPFF